MEIGPGTGVKHLIPKKFLSLTVSPLRPHPDSRIAWAMVTLAGTRNSRWLCCAGMTEAAMKSALVMVPFGPAVTLPPTIAAVADRASSGPSIHRRVVRDIRIPPRYTAVTYDLPGTGLPGRSARGAAGVQGRVALAKPVSGRYTDRPHPDRTPV